MSFMFASVLLTVLFAVAADPAIEIPNAVVKIAEEAAVPAADAGVLSKLHVREGAFVEEGAPLAQLFDTEVRLTAERAKLELEIARKRMENDLPLQAAKKSVEVGRAELRRSLETNEKFSKTISDSEIDRQRLVVERGELELQQAEQDRQIAKLTHDVKEQEYRLADEQLRRRTLNSPIKGMVVEVNQQRGEWVQAGETVARVVRLDKLRAEGFVPAKHAALSLKGAAVLLKITDAAGKTLEFLGGIVFVSPEIDPLNSQVRVWAEIKNGELKLRPGLTGTLVVQPQ